MSTIALSYAGPRPDARPRAPRLHLTRRGRLVFGALLVAPVAIALAVSGIAGGVAQAGSSASTASFEYISVASGESLWDLAQWIAPEADPREVVSALVALNQLPSAEVQPGQRLAIPAEYAR
ncbi:LysM peptidoglycan-binding domain-containing protein [Protaetiibacter larvae]|uniref:LysM peptidoglycan-binding domain-containing protein n=1 Tax=Protaetiibacter larvae TaxID=2592654 RepID=A0A5C1Y809_9MICO|nr:LysM peptidoglycan-binding domain-containing protein [Protaetiibacter larvae]QEO09876.1 LysM peptidoglycan-binding domain-containing protein [Protaetiibacter larvae]